MSKKYDEDFYEEEDDIIEDEDEDETPEINFDHWN